MSRQIPFHAKQCEFSFVTEPLASVGLASPIHEQVSGEQDFTGSIKDVSITPPAGEAELEQFHGEDGNGFQNARFNESSFEPAEISGTLVVEDFELFEALFGGEGEEVTGDENAVRYRYGNGSRKYGAILARLNNKSRYKSILLNGFILEETGDITTTDAEGHWEMEFTGKCRPGDYYEEIGTHIEPV